MKQIDTDSNYYNLKTILRSTDKTSCKCSLYNGYNCIMRLQW